MAKSLTAILAEQDAKCDTRAWYRRAMFCALKRGGDTIAEELKTYAFSIRTTGNQLDEAIASGTIECGLTDNGDSIHSAHLLHDKPTT